jgi:hypothetical protein
MTEADRPSGREEVVAIMEAAKEYQERITSILTLASEPKRQYGTGDVQIARMGPALIITSTAQIPETHPVSVMISASTDQKLGIEPQIGLSSIDSPETRDLEFVVPENTKLDFIPTENQVRESNKITGEEKPRRMTRNDWNVLNGILGITEARIRQFEVTI